MGQENVSPAAAGARSGPSHRRKAPHQPCRVDRTSDQHRLPCHRRKRTCLPSAQSALERRKGARRHSPRRIGHGLLIRICDYKAAVLRFIDDFDVPFTNNLAEQDIRMMKVKMKISGGFRTNDGADIFATLRSVVSTARKQRWNILQALMTHGDNLVAHVRA
jgi:hypothetical protein